MLTLDMTAQLAPVAWGMFGLLIVSAAGILAQVLPISGMVNKKPSARTLRPASLPA